MITFDFLRVKNTSYQGSTESLDWALDLHANLSSYGMKNTFAQSKVSQVLEDRLAGKADAQVPAKQLAAGIVKEHTSASYYEDQGSPWQSWLTLFLIYTAVCYLFLGLATLLAGEQVRFFMISLPPLISLIAVSFHLLWKFLLGFLKIPLATALLAVLLLAIVLISPHLLNDNSLLANSDRLASWIPALLGSALLLVTAAVYHSIEKGYLPRRRRNLTDTRWLAAARSYTRQQLLTNEKYLETHLQAAQKAAQQQNLPLVKVCGNPASYMKTAPQDTAYKPWTQMLGYATICLLMLVMALILPLFTGINPALFYLLAAVQVLGAFASYREYKRKTSR